MKKVDRQELDRVKKALAEAKPGTPEYAMLLEQRIKFMEAVDKEGNNANLIPGVKNDTIAAGVIGAAQIGILAYLQDVKYLAKNLINLLPNFRIR